MDETKVEQVDWRIQLGAPLVVFALYVLSVGPVAWLDEHDVIPDSTRIVYAPLGLLVKGSEAFLSAMEWYLSFWVTDSP